MFPKHLQAYVEERVRSGKNASVSEVIFEAVEKEKLEEILAALDEADAELDAGLGRECTPKEFMDEICAELGITR